MNITYHQITPHESSLSVLTMNALTTKRGNSGRRHNGHYNHLQYKSSDQHYLKQASIDQNFRSVKRGEIFPNASLVDLNGNLVNLSTIIDHRTTILEAGSLTSPSFMHHTEQIDRLQNLFPKVNFITIYVQEAYPGFKVSKHKSLRQKISYARKLKTYLHKDRIVLVDSLEGTAHNYLGNMPNSCILLNNEQRVIYRSNWCKPCDLETLLSGLILSSHDAPDHGETLSELPN
ncbi:MAG: deiodinase-like protein [Bdellovibrionota bacterium]